MFVQPVRARGVILALVWVECPWQSVRPAHTIMSAPAIILQTMKVYFMMKHDPKNVERLVDTLYAVSDPRSPRYGQ